MKILIQLNPHDCDAIDDTITVLKSLPGYRGDEHDSDSVNSVPSKEVIGFASREPAPQSAPPAATAPTEQDLVDALMAFAKTKGFAAASALLREFGVGRVTELASEQRAQFIERTTGPAPEIG